MINFYLKIKLKLRLMTEYTALSNDELVDIGKQLKLNYNWTLYYHIKNNKNYYNDNTIKLIDISNVSDFWGTYNNIPKPSKFFYDGMNYKKMKSTNETPSAYSLFKDNIFPAWEEDSNLNGFEFSIKYYNYNSIDKIWLDYLLILISNDYEHIDKFNGIRIVDCSIHSKIMYRIELWFSDINDKNIIDKTLKTDFNNITSKILFREHKVLKEKK